MPSPVVADLSGKICVVTGANTGIGKEVARELARMRATVVLACRGLERGEAARDEIARDTGSKTLALMPLDLSRQASVRAFARELKARYPAISILVNNAGGWQTARVETPDGVEQTFAANVLHTHLLTSLLLEQLKAGAPSRIVNVASTFADGLDLSDPEYKRRRYDGLKAYKASKQALRMLTWRLAEQLRDAGVAANAFSPGLVKTELNRAASGFVAASLGFMGKLFGLSPSAGADTGVWLAADPALAGVTGTFFEKRKELPCRFRDPAEIEALAEFLDATLAPRRDIQGALQ
jgi:NAD(P)-dependent dehydrogenase (short-subunit alcohol dehydrogenase family)